MRHASGLRSTSSLTSSHKATTVAAVTVCMLCNVLYCILLLHIALLQASSFRWSYNRMRTVQQGAQAARPHLGYSQGTLALHFFESEP